MIKTEKTILVDVDDTILHWRDGFMKYAIEHGYKPLENKEWVFDIGEAFGLKRHVTEQLITDFNSGHWRFGALDTLPDAKEVLNDLHRNHGYRFVAISSCMSHPTVVALRRVNLHHSFGDMFDEVHCLDLHEHKESYLSKYEPTFWVEDRGEQADAGIKTGHTSFLLNRPWNRHFQSHPSVIRCNNWFEIKEYILTKKELT